MSEVSGLEYDIFISYSHNDNYPLTGNDGWVDCFHNTLENWLLRRRGLKKLTIWRDKELQGNTRFDDAIENKIKSCALFFVLHSVNYQHSDYCKKELEIFTQSHQQGSLNVGEQSRVFHILLNNFPYKDWPPQLSGTSGFPMHDADNDQSLGDFIAPNKDAFQEQLRKIVDASEAIIKDMAKATPDQDQPSQSKADLPIFIADTADSQRAFRKRLIADLKERGHHLISTVPPPYAYAEHQQHVTEQLQKTQISIHLLGAYPGRDFDDHEQSNYPQEQAEIALRSDAKKLIWASADLDIPAIEEQPYRDWIMQLNNGDRQHGDYQFIYNNEAAFTNIILQEIDKLKQNQQTEVMEQSFLIDTHQKDQLHAYQLAGLMAGQGLNVEFNKESSNPVESMNLFEQNVAQVPNLIIIFGQVSPKWLAGRIRHAVKIIASQFEQEASQQLENIWIYLTPDNQGADSLPKLPPLIPVHLLDNSNSSIIDHELIGTLLQGAS